MSSDKNRVLLATGNKGKILEISGLLERFDLEVLSLNDFPGLEGAEETGLTFEENALLKAGHACKVAGLTAIADDSGLMVDVLGGRPGVRSARFYLLPELDPGQEPALERKQEELQDKARDQANISKLLRLLDGVPEEKRQAAFCSVIAAVAPDGSSITARGLWHGVIAMNPEGNNGFGYDPVFFDPELGLTAAQMGLNLKNSRSHRAKALQKLLRLWPGFWSSFSKGSRGKS